MARKQTIILQDALPVAERRRVEALQLAIAMRAAAGPGQEYAHLEAYTNDAEAIEAWIEEPTRNAAPLPAGEHDYGAAFGADSH